MQIDGKNGCGIPYNISMPRNIALSLFWFLLATLTACRLEAEAQPATVPLEQPPVITRTSRPSVTPIPPPTKRATITPEPTSLRVIVSVTPAFNPRGQRIIFQAEDGQELVGYYYIAPHPNAPVVVMMHQFMSSQANAWEQSDLIPWLQNYPPQTSGVTPTPSAQGMLPNMPPDVHFNVLTFDFRGHGESGGKRAAYLTDEAKNWYLLDAKAAYALARTLPYADPNRIIGFGTSIGADAALNACYEGCAGTFSISPGSYLGQDWASHAYRVSNAGKPVRCMFSFNDGEPARTCTSLPVNAYYRLLAYEGKKHGENFLVPRKMEANFGQILLDFLLEAARQ